MTPDEFRALVTGDGPALLAALPPYPAKDDIVSTVSEWRRRGIPPVLVSALLTQARLRGRGRRKFGDFADRLVYTEAGLEQATRLSVAAHHAGRFRRAGITSVADLGCGIGGDALAFAGIGADVLAVDADEVTAAVATLNLAPFDSVVVRHARAEDVDLDGCEGVYLDPARRTAGHQDTRRIADPDEFSPPLSFALATAARRPTGVKLGPALDRDLIPAEAEAQWVSVDGEVVETGLWFGALAREGVRRAALVLGREGAAELTADGDSPDAEERRLGAYLYEPDGAVIRARLIGRLAERMNAGMLSAGIAYLTADTLEATPFATAFRVIESLPADERGLSRALASRGVGTLEIKKRGVDVDPAALRRRLRLRGRTSATVVLTRVAGSHRAILVERVERADQ